MTTTTVGPKGQVVIQKSIRDELGVKPGWRAVQRLVDGHVEIHFLPAKHNRSLFGAAAPYVKRSLSPDDWDRAREQAWADHVREMMDDTRT
ncbi:MAG TPA: AbrB/MazE/SpoVT family DNA-binding domain-containing protein [Chloroflexota bacterium]|nr:AbrB/MazE/SpoVT family DNA-binding domain-containing protein [Chloroflexota bacterium]